MRYIFLPTLLFTFLFCDVFSMKSFEADFTQHVTNEKGDVLEYQGHLKAMKPQYAFWEYTKPSTKLIYVNNNEAIIIEPDLEQVIVKKLHTNIDFFKLIIKAKKINSNTYRTKFQSLYYTLHVENSMIKSIEYKDQLDNVILIKFTNVQIDKTIDTQEFTPDIPPRYDLIQG